MATARGEGVEPLLDVEFVREHARAVTAVLSMIGYALVAGAFAGVVSLFPSLSRDTVLLFSDLIAVVNLCALVSLLAGAYFIRRGRIRRHRAAMLVAFGFILAFLVLYLWKVGGGFEKSFVVREGQFLAAHAGAIRTGYLLMLAVHILLSVAAVPVVLYAIVLGLTHTPGELSGTAKATVGRVAVAAWSLSLALGVITYVMLNHVYAWEPLLAGPL
jgi:putative membrane protein